jgi:hypothetical protein
MAFVNLPEMEMHLLRQSMHLCHGGLELDQRGSAVGVQDSVHFQTSGVVLNESAADVRNPRLGHSDEDGSLEQIERTRFGVDNARNLKGRAWRERQVARESH